MQGSITIPGSPNELPVRDPNCMMCAQGFFDAHLHPDGSGRALSRDGHTIYIQTIENDIPTCTCPNGVHSQGKRPKCYHTDNYLSLRVLRERIAERLTAPGNRLTLEGLY